VSAARPSGGIRIAIRWDLISPGGSFRVTFIPVIAIALFVAGAAVGAEAHALTAPAASSTIVSGSFASAYSKSPAPQGEEVAAKVKEALKDDPALNGAGESVTVTAAGGVVTLEGTVPTVQLRAKIGEAALKVEGVDKLVNKLKLRRTRVGLVGS
jgi:ABC-type phosphate transport system substrate-binding protein